MIIKKFVERDSRSTMAKIRDEFGSEAVVLSSRSVGDEFEMVAAANYDEHDVLQHCEESTRPDARPKSAGAKNESVETASSEISAKRASASKGPLANSDEPTLSTLQIELAGLKELIQKELPRYSVATRETGKKNVSVLKARFARMGLSSTFVSEILQDLDETDDLKEGWERAVKHLHDALPENEEELIEQGGIAAFVGPVGTGKTSTIAKIAAQHLMAHGRGDIGIISTGGFKDSINNRLIKFAKAMDIPCIEARTATNLKAALEKFSNKKLVLIDTPGMEANDLRLSMQLAEFRLANHPIDSYLVVSAESRGKHLEKTIDAYSRYNPVGLVVTKLDKPQALGGIIETLIRKKAALSYISDGTRIPGDFHIGGSKNLMKRALELVGRSGKTPNKNATPKQKKTVNSVSSEHLQKVVG